MSSLRDKVGKAFIGTLLTYLSLVAWAVPAGAAGEDCGTVTRIDLDSDTRSFGIEGTEIFEIDVPSPGILALEATVPAGAPVEPKLALVDDGCEMLDAGRGWIESRVAGIVLEVESSRAFRFAVAPRSPFAPLGPYKVMTRFASWSELCGDGALEPKTLVEPEREPDLSTFCMAKTLVEPEREPDLGKTLVEPEREPDLLALTSARLCRNGDDHGDLVGCATRLVPGKSETGRLENAWGDDTDVFRFSLDHRTTAVIGVESTAGAVSVGLYDEAGHRLVLDEEENLYAATLAPGSYHLRLGSPIGDAGYRLSVKAVGW